MLRLRFIWVWAYLSLDFWSEKILGVAYLVLDLCRGFYPPLPLQIILPLISPSIAEGARGWVSLEVSKLPASLKSKNLQNQEKADFSKVDIANAKSSIASLANAKSNNANFASANLPTPKPPPQGRGF